MNANTRNYRATFILDNRGTEDSIEKIIEEVKSEITAVKGTVGAVENLGKRDFVRVTDKKLTGAVYVQVDFSAGAEAPVALKERLRLKHHVYRTFVQSI
jgi:small subunit ribosomal protein S6